MIKLLKVFFIFLSLVFLTLGKVSANNAFISVVNPVRGYDFWETKNQTPQTVVDGELAILRKNDIPATWLIRYDALLDNDIVGKLRNTLDEKGLFLEVTPSWTQDAVVAYHQSESWHSAGSAFLTGYELSDREKLIDKGFAKFKESFGEYPKSVGAWWIDAHSLDYMQKKYAITTALIVADQYSTDNYQIWGQYFSTPYYPSKTNALYPAQNIDEKIPLVMVQWAARDPVNSYGNGVLESTYSVQLNDYIDYHNLDTNYFSKLVDIYISQPLNDFGQMVVGLENSYSWPRFQKEYLNQINTLTNKKNKGQLSLVTLSNFASWYQKEFPKLSPEQIIVANDPLDTYKKTIWFMNPYYRAGWFLNQDGSVFRDIRQYVGGTQELCYTKRCDSVNFATTAVRVLDEISFGHKWILDTGKINNLKVEKDGLNYNITYQNEAGKLRTITFLPRDIGVDNKVLSIDTAILEATKKDVETKQINILQLGFPTISWSILLNIIKFGLFLIVVCIAPGLALLKDMRKPIWQKIFFAIITGFVLLTLIFYIASLLKIRFVVSIYLVLNLFIFFRLKLFKISIKLRKINKLNFFILAVILSGTFFQLIPVFASGLQFPYGIGFWGPNTHDGIWHLALINQLKVMVPPQNPIFSGEVLKNYHYFYDLLIAATAYFTLIPISDLLFRYFPLVFSLSLGVGTYYLMEEIFKNKIATLFALYFVYFAGSFGWIVEFIKQRHFGGESAFWANQSISFNLNPPFAISLIIVIALFQMLPFKGKTTKSTFFINVILIGCLIAFKSYAGLLILVSILILGIITLIWDRDLSFLTLFSLGGLISAILFLSNFKFSSSLLQIAPFWFINSMIDAPDRVGWQRLSLMRMVGFSQKLWLKFFASESISFVIFIIGNLGVRFLSLGSLSKFKYIFINRVLLFMMIVAVLSVFIPTVFIQAGNPWNTIQFIYYYLYIAAIISGVVIWWLIYRLPKIVSFILIVLILILTPINSMVTASGYLTQKPHAYVSNMELQGLNFLTTLPRGVVLTLPYDEQLKNEITQPWPLLAYDSTAYVSALSHDATFLEDYAQNQILLTNYKARLVASNDFFLSPQNQQVQFLQKENIKYIYLPKIYGRHLDESSSIKKIFENDEVVIYQYQ